MYKVLFEDSLVPKYKMLGKTMIIPNDWGHFLHFLNNDILVHGNVSLMGASVMKPHFNIEGDPNKHWWRSKERASIVYPYGGWLSTKQWHLNEE